MPTIASRELRNHTADVLRRVADGSTITVTVNGDPVAQITRVQRSARTHLTPDDVAEMVAQQRPDASLVGDLLWISGDTTDDLDPIR